MSLREVYNRKVTTVRWMRRQGNWSGSQGRGFHDGLLIEDATGHAWLVHITTPVGSRPVLVDAAQMSSKWYCSDAKSANVSGQGKTIGDVMGVAEGRGGYGYVCNNCVELSVALLKFFGVFPDVEGCD